jgi:hypothetical protein
LFFACATSLLAADAARKFYQPPAWQPRAILPTDDALSEHFWPPSPPVKVDYNDPGFDEDRLSPVPDPGVHPRVLITPTDVDRIRAKIALGEKAPAPFQVMWERVKRSRSAFYAMVAQDDALGKQLAAELAEKVKTLTPKLDAFDARPDRDNIWVDERSTIASGTPNPPTEIWDLLDYDYLYQWLTPEQRDATRAAVARLIHHRISNFMMVPDHYMINNHEGFGMEFIRLMLLIEGEPGFDQKTFDVAADKVRAFLNWDLDADGMCYESIKGWLNDSAFVAVGLRKRDLLKHDHLRAKMRFFQAAARWENGQWHIRDEMRASAFHVIWMMHYLHPRDEGIDFLYRATLTTHDFLNDPNAKWPNPVGIVPELLCLWADDGITDSAGKPQDWTDQARIDSLHLPLNWHDNQRGYIDFRNTWQKDDLHVGFACKQDFFYGGHEGSENGRLILWKDGVNWIQDTNMLATKATFLQNMLTVDGMGVHWPPAPGTWLGTQEADSAAIAAADTKDGYSYTKSMQVHPLDFPSAKLPYYAPFAEANYDLTRDIQVAFNPRTIAFTDGYAHTDYGPWSGETRLVEGYRQFNPMRQAYRTVAMLRGEHPYVMVLDDARKDDQPHLYEWNITVPPDAQLIDATTPEVVFQNTEPARTREDDLVLGLSGTPRDKTGKLTPKKGDPLCLIRVLWRNTDYGFPVPHLEQFQGFNHLVIPAPSISPEFRVLIYPYRQGDPIPKTDWNADRSQLSVVIDKQSDVYHLATTDGGRTVFSVDRDGQPIIASQAPPQRPTITVRNDRFDASALRYTRIDGVSPTYLTDGHTMAMLRRPAAPAVVRYTLDGTDPTAASPVYQSPLLIDKSAQLRCAVFDPSWTAGPTQSGILAANFVARPPASATAEAPANSKPGLMVRVYEIKTVLWNDKGFFDAGKIMMPEVSADQPIAAAVTDRFALPHVTPQAPQIEQRKGFYRFTGFFNAPRAGVYQFAVDSCGPVTLDVGGQAAIEAIGVFHQQQTIRRGEAILAAGWQPIELVVCDPQFWNLNSLDPMPFAVSYRIDGGETTAITPDMLCCQPTEGIQPADPAPAWHDALTSLPQLEPGVMLNVYDRTGKRRAPDFLDIDDQTPMRSEQTLMIESNPSVNQARCYDGYFNAPMDGVYTFNMPLRQGESAGLGAPQATCQNQLRIDDEIVVQRGIPGRMPTRAIGLKAGYHTISIRLGLSAIPATVTYPDGQTLPLSAESLSRPVLVRILPAGQLVQKREYEIFTATPVSLSLPTDPKAEIHYSTSGQPPRATDPTYTTPITLDKSTLITAAAFADGQPITAPATVRFDRVDVPTLGLLGEVHFDQWDGSPGPLKTDASFGVMISPDCALVDGPHGKALSVNRSLAAPAANGEKQPMVDVNVSRGVARAGFRFFGIPMRENSITVAVWFRSPSGNGKLFGKEGYNAFGKGYKTVSCSLAGGRLSAGPGHVFGGKPKAGDWQQVVLTDDEHQIAIYLNGQPVGSGPGSVDLTTDAMDFFTDHAADVSSVRFYNRVLSPEDIQQLYTKETAP